MAFFQLLVKKKKKKTLSQLGLWSDILFLESFPRMAPYGTSLYPGDYLLPVQGVVYQGKGIETNLIWLTSYSDARPIRFKNQCLRLELNRVTVPINAIVKRLEDAPPECGIEKIVFLCMYTRLGVGLCTNAFPTHILRCLHFYLLLKWDESITSMAKFFLSFCPYTEGTRYQTPPRPPPPSHSTLLPEMVVVDRLGWCCDYPRFKCLRRRRNNII